MKIVALVPFDIYPSSFGGAQRCTNLLERVGPITVIALDWFNQNRVEQHGDVTYKTIYAGDKAVIRARKLFGQDLYTYDGMPAFCQVDLAHFQEAIDAEQPDLIILEHPWLYPFVGDVPFIYDAHNAEAFLTSLRWPGGIDEQVVKELERAAVTNAKAITYCSELDADILRKFYPVIAPMHFIPNGTDLPDKLAEGKTKNLIFVGGYYGPNVVAAQELANQAHLLPDYTIQLIGACGEKVRTTQPNVRLYGHVTDEQLDQLHRDAFAFVNLMQTGSGTSLKVARAMSYGLPVISTKIGARGYDGVELVERGQDITQALELIANDWDTYSKTSRAYAEKISWVRVGAKFRMVVGSA
jgi:glycosyltransferase involved in cell wall biosynthesis